MSYLHGLPRTPRDAASHEEAHLHFCVTDKVYKALVVDVWTSQIL